MSRVLSDRHTLDDASITVGVSVDDAIVGYTSETPYNSTDLKRQNDLIF